MGLEFCYVMICGVEINLSRINFQIFLGWLALKMLPCYKHVSRNGDQNRWNIKFLTKFL